MADCCKIIRLLKEVKRKADTSFCEINQKITRLESKYTLLCKQNDELKKDIEESKRKLAEINLQQGTLDPSNPEVPAMAKRVRRRGGSRGSKRPALKKRKLQRVRKRCSPKRPNRGRSKRRNVCPK